jgi:glycosyltransferase involved in cell wall biosynthesis
MHLVCLLSILFFQFCFAANHSPQFVLIVPSYNNAEFYEKNLDSILIQTYPNYRVLYIDDASTDQTAHLVQKWIVDHHVEEKFTLIQNKTNQGGLKNIYEACHLCKKNEIVCLLDGDDWLFSKDTLSILASYYENPSVWMTYGQFIFHPSNNPGICAPIDPQDLLQQKTRQLKWVTTHLKTFYAGLFQKIRKEDLQYEEKFVPSATDLAIMFPLLDMATTHVAFIPEFTYVYNCKNPLSHHQIRHDEQRFFCSLIRSRPVYPPLDLPPYE